MSVPRRAEPAGPFDAWLRDSLAREYDRALCEPLPDEIGRLLDGLPER